MKRNVDSQNRAQTVGQQLAQRLGVTLTLRPAADSKRIRATTLLVIFVVAFAIAGAARVFSPMQLLAQSPINLDLALRTLSAGWFAPRDLIPVTLVEIDDATHRSWGSPAVTPREPLVTLIDRVARTAPSAVVVDIDLGWGGEDPGLTVLREFLAGYAGPAPLIFPKRLEPVAGGLRRAAPSPLDDIFTANDNLAWAHASLETDSGGVVRQWADWIEVCSEEGTQQMASIPARLSLLLEPLPPGLRRSTPPPLAGSCRRADDPPGQLLLIGPRLTGPAQIGMTADAAAISALNLLDPDMDLDDAWLFTGRVVLIGATHPASGDFWLTPSGVVPGVELLAHTVRFATLRGADGWRMQLAQRIAVLAAFLIFAAVSLYLRGLAAALAYLAGGLLFVAVPIWLWDFYRVFEALELAVLLFVLYKFLQTLLDMVEDWKQHRAQHAPGWRGRLRTVWAVCRKPDSGGDADD